LKLGVTQLPDLSRLSHDEKDALIRALWAQVQTLTAQVAALEARLGPTWTPKFTFTFLFNYLGIGQ
jgi:hypothetical protein